jgi:hypothetical protein
VRLTSLPQAAIRRPIFAAFGLHEDDLRGAPRLCHYPTESRKYSNADDETAMASILDKTHR